MHPWKISSPYRFPLICEIGAICGLFSSPNFLKERASRSSLPQFQDKIIGIWKRNLARGIELRNQVRRQRPSSRSDITFELLDPARPDNRRSNPGLLQQPIKDQK